MSWLYQIAQPIGFLLVVGFVIVAYDRGLHERILPMPEEEFREHVRETVKNRPLVMLQLCVITLLYIQVAMIEVPKTGTLHSPQFELMRVIAGTLTACMLVGIYIWLELVQINS